MAWLTVFPHLIIQFTVYVSILCLLPGGLRLRFLYPILLLIQPTVARAYLMQSIMLTALRDAEMGLPRGS